jgi:hypothetical protein
MDIAHEWISLPTDAKVREREHQTVEPAKLMPIVVRNPNGFHLIDVLQNGANSTQAIP